MAKKKNWSQIEDQSYVQTAQGRDVYEMQQLKRSEFQEEQTMTSRLILCIICSVATFFLVYIIYAFFVYVGGLFHLGATDGSFGNGNAVIQDDNGSGSGGSGMSGGDTEVTHTGGQTQYYIPFDQVGDTEFLDFMGDTDVEVAKDGTSGDGSSYESTHQTGQGMDTGKTDGSTGNMEKGSAKKAGTGFQLWPPKSFWHVFWSFIAALIVFGIMYPLMRRNLDAQNALIKDEDINYYENDQHIALPEEIQRKYDWFPDVGAHSSVQVSSMISHMALLNKGVKEVPVARRYGADVLSEDGSIVYHKGEIIYGPDGEPEYDMMPMFDTKFSDELFKASGMPKLVRMSYDVRGIPYNPGGENREKLKYDTVLDLINEDWTFPAYEPQRPAGAYIVDTAPVNTMVLAITRAGKGQTVIEPTLDMWTREMRPNNIVVNDPKGELLVKFYARATYRGFQLVQFNLINAMKTDIYNPLMMAAQSAREGDFTKCAMYVENIAEVFFPTDGGEDPVWPNAANNAFKRAAYGLIDYYLEAEKSYREECAMRIARGEHISQKTIETHVDAMWGRVTLYNCYQMFVQLTSKKLTNPAKEFATQMKAGAFDDMTQEELDRKADEINKRAELWQGSPEADCLTLYFNATDKLPRNSMRTLVANANNALKAMAGAEKMMASVYGIAITAMSFFTDPTISTLTSGTPSQNVDLAGYSFPRRIGVRFHPDFIAQNHYVGLRAKWSAYEDRDFKNSLGKLFSHADIVNREGWAKYYFDGKFPKDVAYVKLELLNASTDVLVKTYYFEVRKSYQTTLDGRSYMKDPILGTKIAKDGVIYELIKNKEGKFVAGSTKFKRKVLKLQERGFEEVTYEVVNDRIPVITQTYMKYAEKPKMTFLVTPPHLMKYAKLILILIKQLVDLNFDQSYMTKENQKPLYKTRYMLDELGNLQSEGHGIANFETMLSIGLGQDQQFTLILQTLQQLRDVYGESCDKIVQGNTSNIVFLKSTDDSMLDTLQKMSGTTHKSYIEQKTVTSDLERIFMKNEGKISYMKTTKEVPVISYNDMAFIAERNSIVFRAGDSPIWNKNQTILPMSWRLFLNTIKVPGRDFSLQTIPTLSSAVDFDLKKNQPDFAAMLKERMDKALLIDDCIEQYKIEFGYDDADFNRLDLDVRSDDIMKMVEDNIRLSMEREAFTREAAESMEDDDFDPWDTSRFDDMDFEDNTEVMKAVEEEQAKDAFRQAKIYAGGRISRSDLMDGIFAVHRFDQIFINAYLDVRGDFEQDPLFRFKDGNLYDMEGNPLITQVSKTEKDAIVNAQYDPKANVYAEEEVHEEELDRFATYAVEDMFYIFLSSLDRWDFAKGRFEESVIRIMQMEEA